MTKIIAGIILAMLTAGGWYLKWRLSPERKAARDRKDKAAGHRANAAKQGITLQDWFNKRWKR